MAALEVQITKSFPGGLDSAPFRLAVSFAVGDGVTVLFGPSGSGKTLTLECVAGFARPDEGQIRLDQRKLFDSAGRIDLPARLRRCGYVFQRDALFPHMSVRQNLEFAVSALAQPEAGRRVQEVLEQFRLSHLAARRPQEISGGERQRCAIARTLVNHPRFLLLDEPARGLDIGLRQQLYMILRQVRAEYGLPMLLVTHDLEEAFALGDRMLVCQAGLIVQDGPPREVYERPVSAAVARLLGILNLFEGHVVELDPEHDLTRLRAVGLDICTSYLPAYRLGDPVRFCIRPEKVIATPRNGVAHSGQLTLPVEQAVEMSDQVLLEFAGPICAQVPRAFYEKRRDTREWLIEFPRDGVWVFPRDHGPESGSWAGPAE